MAKFTKHVGRHSGTGQRLSVVFLQLPDDKENALVVYSDSLPDRYHDDFMTALESPEGQEGANLYEVLARKVFWHGTTMLDTLHKERHLVKVPTAQVIMMPNSNTSIPLDDILAQMDQPEEVTTATNDTTQDRTSSLVDDNIEDSQKDENRQIAQNLLIQAGLLDTEAAAKRKEAYKYDPSLAKVVDKTTKAKVRVTSTATNEDGTPVKRGRGRPKKSEA